MKNYVFSMHQTKYFVFCLFDFPVIRTNFILQGFFQVRSQRHLWDFHGFHYFHVKKLPLENRFLVSFLRDFTKNRKTLSEVCFDRKKSISRNIFKGRVLLFRQSIILFLVELVSRNFCCYSVHEMNSRLFYVFR